MKTKKILNIVGLSFGIIGVVIIFFYGPPQPSFFPYDIITDDNFHQEVLEMREKYDLYSKIGLGFIFSGFLLQLISVCISYQSNTVPIEKIENTNNGSTLDEEDPIKK